MAELALGSLIWAGIAQMDKEDELYHRTAAFVGAIKWQALTSLASRMRAVDCQLSEKYSVGHFNLVRRLQFADGVSWVARLRLPELPSMFGQREALEAGECMRIEIATMRYLRLKTAIPVPEVFAHDLSPDNEVGAPYIFMDYMHGTSAAELSELRGCGPEVFGTPEQDASFRRQMAFIHVQLASLTFDRIGSLRESRDSPGHFFVGSEIETGEGPWNTAQQYYTTVARHRLKVAEHESEPEVRESHSFGLPQTFCELMPLLHSRDTGIYGLANRDFGAHNVLVDGDFNVVGIIDFDGVIAAPIEVVAQMPLFAGLERPIPGFVPTNEFALKRLEKTKHRVPQYVEFVRAAIVESEAAAGFADKSGLVEAMVSDAASVVQGMNAYGQHQGFVNDRWMAAYAWMREKKWMNDRRTAAFARLHEEPTGHSHFGDETFQGPYT